MGCSPSVYEQPSTFNTILTKEQVLLINESWIKITPYLSNIGKQIFLRIFEKKPESKLLFPFRDYWGDDLVKHPVFSAHAHRFLKTLEQAVKHASTIERSVAPVMVDLGHFHRDKAGMTTEYFSTFSEAIIYVLRHNLGDHMDEDTELAWRTLIGFIVGKIHHGYQQPKHSFNFKDLPISRSFDIHNDNNTS